MDTGDDEGHTDEALIASTCGKRDGSRVFKRWVWRIRGVMIRLREVAGDDVVMQRSGG